MKDTCLVYDPLEDTEEELLRPGVDPDLLSYLHPFKSCLCQDRKKIQL